MKKQNPNNKLVFNKVAVTELNDDQMHDVDGGTFPLCFSVTIAITIAIEANN